MTENNTRNPTRPSQKRFLPQASALGLVLFALVLGEFGFRAFRDKGWSVYPPQDGLAHGQVQAIATGPDGVVWVGSERGLSRFDGQAWTIWTERDGLPDGDIRSISISVDGMVWLCTGQGYVRLVDGEWASYKRLDIVLRNWIMFMEAKENEWPIAVAPDGSLWFGTDNGALHFSEPQASGGVFPTWTLYDKNDGLPDASVLSIAIGPEGEVWVGTERGVARYDGQVWRTYSKRDGLAHDRVIAVAVASDGTAWFSTRRGLSRFDGQSWKTLPLAALGLRHSPKALAVDGQHRLWMETHKGIGAWDEHEGAPLWVLRTWLFLRMVLGGASFILAAVLVLDSAWGKRFVRLAGDWIRSRWLRLKAFLSGMWARSCNVVLAIRPRDSLNRFVLHHRTTLVPIAFLVLFSLLLRFWQLDYGQMLPYVAHADEHTQYNPAIRVVRDGEFNPHFFNYPSLTIYIDALVLAVASRLGIWFGVLDSLDDLQLIRTAGYARGMLGTPGMLWLGRATTAVFGALTAALVFILAGQL
ncbi:MAG: hypothetical protein JXA89_13530, partial [Anaerolineae bacterium]|nr:hypothetical protein [Anaerolineae bacterium]